MHCWNKVFSIQGSQIRDLKAKAQRCCINFLTQFILKDMFYIVIFICYFQMHRSYYFQNISNAIAIRRMAQDRTSPPWLTLSNGLVPSGELMLAELHVAIWVNATFIFLFLFFFFFFFGGGGCCGAVVHVCKIKRDFEVISSHLLCYSVVIM